MEYNEKKVFRLEMKTLDTHIAYNPVVCLYIHKHKKITNYLKMKHKKIPKRITQWALMPLGPTLIFTTETIIKNMTKKTVEYLLKIFISPKKQARDKPNRTLCPLGQHLSTQLKTYLP